MSEQVVSPLPKAFSGRWRHVAPWDSDDYLSEYLVEVDGDVIRISGKDLNDGEQFVMSEISWDGTALRFRSLMRSTRREGLNEFRLLEDGSVESRFTFTVVERLVRNET